jgi:hypothetical protein
MSVVAYRPVATVTAKAKGRDAPLAAFSFSPTPSTATRLANQRMLFRPFPGGFRLAAQHDLAGGGGPVVPIADTVPLLFAIRCGGGLQEGEAADKSGPSLFLSNRNAAGTPQGGPGLSREEFVGPKDRAWIVPRRHRARIALGTGNKPNRIELRNYFGGAAIGDPLPIEAGAQAETADVTIGLEAQEGIAFLLRPKPQGTDRLIVADDELVEMRADGVLELVLKNFPGQVPAGGRQFTATFERPG